MNATTINKLSLLNFKGVGQLDIDFNGKEAVISGANGTGKTTIFDAFCWVLFGKDSHGSTDFNIKTLDNNGVAIERLPHEVSAELQFNGAEGLQTILLKRVWKEKWQKKKGSPVEEFTGHETELYINNVPFTLTDYKLKVDEICSEELFKLITNPHYFTSLKKDVQRLKLFALVGGVNEADIAKGVPMFEELLSKLVGKTLEGYKRELALRKTKIKEEDKGLPERIDEARRSVPLMKDWTSLEKKLAELITVKDKIEAEMLDASKGVERTNGERSALLLKKSSAEIRIQTLKHNVKENSLVGYRQELSKRTESRGILQSLKRQLNTLELVAKEWNTREAEVGRRLTELRDLYIKINNETLEFKEGTFDCPTCKRALDVSDIEAKKTELIEAFNRDKASRLEENKKVGLSVKAQFDEFKVNNTQVEIDKLNAEIAKLELELAKPEPIEPNCDKLYEVDQEIAEEELNLKAINDTIEGIVTVAPVGVPELTSKRNSIQEEIDGVRLELATKTQIETQKARVAELESLKNALSVELAEIERLEYSIAQFTKAKIEIIEGKLNSRFSIVKFNLYEYLLGGGEREICEASVNGVPFSDLNTASKINAGLDIISVFSKEYNTKAPIFIDNRESVTEVLPIETQIISLVVNPAFKKLNVSIL